MSSAAAPTSPAPVRRRRALPWIIAGVGVIGLAVAAWFIAEAVVRDQVTKTIRELAITNLALPDDQQIDVELSGMVLPQVIGGTLTDIKVSSDNVVLGSFAGDVVVTASAVPVRGDGNIADGVAEVTINADQLRDLMKGIDGFPVDTLGIAEPDVTVSTELSAFGVKLPVGISLVPSAADGQVVLTPASVQLAGSDISTDELRRQFGLLSNTVLKDWPVCIASYLPAGVTITDLAVEGDHLNAKFAVADEIIVDAALQKNGVCD